ncbi:ABC transporter permease [Streptomyces sp. SL13]|uniref:ABC transporter permease n=1 Tax=Streptantibioticus silvisoli TaxID=2705255 RepID=A0AA90H477_9ACTN|nr:ABC transporter permease [Streptantibioticus silvisoli]MDI5967882.1 ABC transporter permease [Streptantibioticus silvisoli]
MTGTPLAAPVAGADADTAAAAHAETDAAVVAHAHADAVAATHAETDAAAESDADADADPGRTADAVAPGREIFLPVGARRRTPLGTIRRRLRWPLGIYTTPVLLLVAWQILSGTGVLSAAYAPAPSAIVANAVDLWRQGVLGPDLAVSLRRAGLGLALGLTVGVTAGVLGGLLRRGEYLFNGVVQVLNTVPLLAVLPLMIVWFGIGETTKVLLISFGAGVPMYLNLFAAIRGVDQRLIEMARTTGAGTWRLVSRVLVPGALPGFLVGLRFSLAYSVLGLVAAETVNADQGLGFLITQGQTYLQTGQVFVGLAVYSLLGLLADQFVRILERVLLRWRPGYEAS